MNDFDLAIAEIEAEGWHVWHLGKRQRGWEAVLATHAYHRAIVDWEGRAKGGYSGGFSRKGVGPTPAAAIRDAAVDILPLDVASMLA